MFTGLPPGSILLLMYFYERVKKLNPGTFIEVGPGSGEISKILLDLGWSGSGIDLQPEVIERLSNRFSNEISRGKYIVHCGDFNNLPSNTVDLILSNQVMEHLTEGEEIIFLAQAKKMLKKSGLFIAIVPSSMKYWSIEDEVVGHYRRYESGYMEARLNFAGFRLNHSSGLTYPVSNLLFPISTYLIKKHESYKLEKSKEEQTVESGIRYVPFKTNFPKWLNIVLNSYVMTPFHFLQKIFGKNEKALNIYYEATISGLD